MKLSRRQKGVLLAIALLIVAAVTALKVHNMLQSGEPVVWLAELWAPAAFMSIGLVTCLEYFMLPERAVAKSAPDKAPARRKRG